MKTKHYLLSSLSFLLLSASVLNAQGDADSSPLMVFEGSEKKSPASSPIDLRREREQHSDEGVISGQESLSERGREGFSSIAEEEGLLTVEHFQESLIQHPNATRFVIDEEEDGKVSIKPRVAATSRLALKKNQGENEAIIEALRESLLARHDNSEEIVDSLLVTEEGAIENVLSAKRLGEILKKSDELASQNTSPQRTPIPFAAETDITSPVDHSGGSNIDDYLDANIHNDLLTTAKANLAIDTSKKAEEATTEIKKLRAERRKKREQKRTVAALESDSDGYSTGTGLRNAVLRQAQKEVALSLLKNTHSANEDIRVEPTEEVEKTNKGWSTISLIKSIGIPFLITAFTSHTLCNVHPTWHEQLIQPLCGKLPTPVDQLLFACPAIEPSPLILPDYCKSEETYKAFTKLAEMKRTQALSASREAVNTREDQFEQKKEAYEAAINAWNKVVTLCEKTLEKNDSAHCDTEALKKLMTEAKANELYSKAHLVTLEARKKEAATIGTPNEAQASELVEAWTDALAAHEEALSKEKETSLEDLKWNADLANAQDKRIFWESKFIESKNRRKAIQLKIEDLKTKIAEAQAQEQAMTDVDKGSEMIFWSKIANNLEQSMKYLGYALKEIKSNNSDDGLLFQEAAQELEKGAERWKEGIGSLERGDKNEENKFNIAGYVLSSQSKEKASKAFARLAEKNGDRALTTKWNEIAILQQQSVNYWMKAAKANEVQNTEEGTSWNNAGLSFYWGADKLEKAIEAAAGGKPEKAVKWREAAALQQRSMEFFTRAAEAFAAERITEGTYWNNAGLGFYGGAEKLGKAIEAEIEGNPGEAAKWREAATLLQQSVKFFTKAAEAHKTGKTEEGNSWHNAGASCYDAAAKLGKAIEAENKGKAEEASKWREAATLQQQSVAIFIKAIEAYKAGKGDEGACWYNTGSGFHYGSKKLEKAIEAEASGKPEEASKWREAGALQQQSIEFFTKAAEAHKAGKTNEGANWYNTGLGFSWRAEKLEKAIRAEIEGKPEKAAKWREAATLLQQSVEFFTKAAEAFAAERITEGTYWNNAGLGFYEGAEKLGKAIEAEIEGNPGEAAKWREAATLLQQSVKFFTKAAEAFAAGKINEENSWYTSIVGLYRKDDNSQKTGEATNLYSAGLGFYRGANNLAKAIEAEIAGDLGKAIKWREAATSQQQSVEYYGQAAIAFVTGKIDEGQSWHNAGAGLFIGGEMLTAAIRAEIENKPEEAVKWYEVATLWHQSTEPFIQAARAYAAGKASEGSNWFKAGYSFYKSAEYHANGDLTKASQELAVAKKLLKEAQRLAVTNK